MAQLVAPYNNSMRLGQGFNSYTHQIRLHNAVTVVPRGYADTPQSSDSETGWMHADDREHRYEEEDEAEEKSQIVTYSTRFVDKISEVVGNANGTYIDSDKFKQSDVNYLVQVRVTNQRLDMKPRSKLNLVTSVKAPTSAPSSLEVADVTGGGDIGSIDLAKFRDVYGDTFISGWEEGGELNALISVKTRNKAKLNKIKGAIEGRLGTPALSGKVSGSIDLEKSDTFSESETTITVNWSGGGKIKEYDILWDINSLTLAATNFSDNVMKTPQRTYAILTRYEELPDFQNKIPNYSALDYDLASVYTYALLDMYTDYKAIWKTLQISSSDADLGRVRLEQARIGEETNTFLLAYKPKKLKATKPPDSGSNDTMDVATSLFLAKTEKGVQPYKPSLFGLQNARTALRYQMLRIVGIVNDLKRNPSLVLDPGLGGDILSPSVFRQLLPVVIPVPVNPNDDWIEPLGTSFSPEQNLSHASFEQFPTAKSSALMNAEKAKHFRMSKWAGPSKPGQGIRFAFTNDLDRLTNGLLINSIRVYYEKLGVTGIAIGYTNGTIFKHGNVKANEHKEYPIRGRSVLSIQIARNVSQAGTESTIEESGLVLFMICFSNLETGQVKTGDYRPSAHDFTFATAPDDHDEKPWNLAGFYSNYDTQTKRIESLGAIWTNDKEALSMPLLPFGMDLDEFPPPLQEKINQNLDKSDRYRLSNFVGTFKYDRGPNTVFDLPALKAEYAFVTKVECFYTTWQAQGFEALCGVRASFGTNLETKQTFAIGDCGQANPQIWNVGENNSGQRFHSIIGIAVTVARGTEEYVAGVKLKMVRAWDTDKKTKHVYVESKPVPSSDKIQILHTKWLSRPLDPGQWSARGFYGNCGTVIDRLGVIWGRDLQEYNQDT